MPFDRPIRPSTMLISSSAVTARLIQKDLYLATKTEATPIHEHIVYSYYRL